MNQKTPEQQAEHLVNRLDGWVTMNSEQRRECKRVILEELRESSKAVPEGKKYRDGLASACDGLQKYVEYFGPIHEDGCSQDDTCRCVFKPTNEDVSCLCVLAANAKGQRDLEARESALSSQGEGKAQ